MPEPKLQISCAVEGVVDEAVLRRVIEHVGAVPGPVYGHEGKNYLRKKLRAFNNAAQYGPWVVLMDLDLDEDCAPPHRAALLPHPSAYMCFRLAVRTIESWLLADRAGLSHFLRAPASLISAVPEEIDHPKQALLEIAARSRSREIREDILPRPASGRTVGPAYNSRLREFVAGQWDPVAASAASDSLARCIRRLRELVEAFP